MSSQHLVIHADDVGMSHGANVAFLELSRLGTITSGSVMVPCPWFPEIAAAAAADSSLDLGVHLTLCAEQWPYRWRPVSNATQASGLIDDDGYLWADVASVRRHAHPEAVEAEWRAQIDRALAAGIDVTHLDAHMGAALAPEFCNRYLRLGVDYHLPVLLTATLEGYAPRTPHLSDVSDERFAPFVDYARKIGLPVFDQVVETDFGRPVSRPADYRAVFAGITGALSFCAFHPAAAGDINVIEPGSCHVRIDEYELFRTGEWQQWLSEQSIELIGMRGLRDDYRAALA
ncbi:MAG: polysaccharide deacetylase family protein [Ilumatobacteraceae bacterium]